MTPILARMAEIVRVTDDSDFGDLLDICEHLLPHLVEMVAADDEGIRAGEAHNDARNAVSGLVVDMAADRATAADVALLAALREPWP